MKHIGFLGSQAKTVSKLLSDMASEKHETVPCACLNLIFLQAIPQPVQCPCLKVEDHVSHIFKNPPGGKNNFVEYQLKNIHFFVLGVMGMLEVS